MTLIAIPTREQLEEMFPTTSRVPLDLTASRMLQSHAAHRVRLTETLRTLEDLRTDPQTGMILEPVNARFRFHYLYLVQQYYQGDENTPAAQRAPINSPEAAHWFAAKLAQADAEQIEYAWRTMELTNATRALVGDAQVHPAMLRATMYIPETMEFGNIMNSYALRRYPHIRFRASVFLQYVLHYEDLDKEGVPRVSLDGYAIANGLQKI